MAVFSILRKETINIENYLTNGKPDLWEFGSSSEAINWIDYIILQGHITDTQKIVIW